MWSQWTEQAKKGFSEFAEKTGEALEKTGDVLTKAATHHQSHHSHARQKPKAPDPNLPRNMEALPAEEVAGHNKNNKTTSSSSGTPKSTNSASAGDDSHSSPQDIRARAAAVLAGVQAREDSSSSSKQKQQQQQQSSSSGNNRIAKPKEVLGHWQKNWSTGWNNVVENAKRGVHAAQDLVEKEQQRLEMLMVRNSHDDRIPNYYSRDLSLPLDVPALKDAEVVYVTDRIISMSHPALPSSSPASDPNNNGIITGERKLAAVAHLLEKRHGSGNVMIWNLSEVTHYHQHAAAVLERVGPVLAFSFPGSPAPPLGLWLQLLLSLEKWLQASPNHVAVVHCLTGKGRTSTVLAAFLCWMAEAGFEKTNMTLALQYIAQCKKMSVQDLTIPSQRRYAQYFTNMLEGVRPSQPPLVLKRIIMSEAPHFALGPPLKNSKNDDNNDTKDNNNKDGNRDNVNNNDNSNKDRMGCAPYLQVFQAGQLLHTVAATLHFQQQPEALPFCQVADGSIAFHVDQVIQGDVLIRCRHLSHSTKQKVSMFRAAFHTGYVPPNVLRFTKEQLDGACHDPRFPDDFFVDLILEPCSAEQTSAFYAQQQKQEQQQQEGTSSPPSTTSSAQGETPPPGGKDQVVSASTYDSMLHRDSRFWDVISKHLKEQEEGQQQQQERDQQDPAKSRMGKTVGKRRVFTEASPSGDSKNGEGSGGTNDNSSKGTAQEPLQTFSIGGELDFLPEPEKKTLPGDGSSKARQQQQPRSPKKDSLMEALMGALGDGDDVHETEEIVFDDTPALPVPASATPVAPQASPTIVALPPAPAPASQEGSKDKAEQKATTETQQSGAPGGKVKQAAEDAHAGAVTAASQASESKTEPEDDMEDLLKTEGSDDVDVEALLGDDGDDDEDFNLDDYNADEEDAELEDLENFLSQTK